MSKETNAKDALMAKLLAVTTANTVKGRGASGKTTYLDRFVKILLDDNGQPLTKGKTRTEINAIMSYDIACEVRAEEIAAGTHSEEFNLDNEADVAFFGELNDKCQKQIAAAVSDSQNSTALSFNVTYKDVWVVVKTGNLVSLAAKQASQVTEAVAE